ncbi:S41 family peptidase [Sinorhizobium psoraleae]|uniref:S41 family peptidase n=1 Tax=Sinorhizobium psoraleae TaxID=520838 RepID=A0ABT4KFE8_9HYPH|nr:S41 family peptidase [Sinorhizobium psoraleae]MCZ4090599.1 S41 family peptidase [Sinorhizobium psoraleae]
MTTRPLAFSPLPDEDWVTVNYKAGRSTYEYRIRWGILHVLSAGTSAPSVRSRQAFAMGVDRESDVVRKVNISMYVPAIEKQRSGVSRASLETFPGVLLHRTIAYKSATYGYIRIFSFNVPNVNAFIKGFTAILQLMPPAGVIIDIRDNPGGVLEAGERLLQLFSPMTVEPARLQFRNSQAVLRLCQNAKKFLQLQPYVASVSRAVESGAMFSLALPLTSPLSATHSGGSIREMLC